MYYSLDRINAENSDVNLIIGQRGNGKTYSCLNFFLHQYRKTKKRFCYIRRWEEDIKTFRMEQLFYPLKKEIIALFGEDFNIVYHQHKFWLVNKDGVKIDVVGYTLSISQVSHTKSTPYTDVGFILFDEFIQMAGENILRDEKTKYENTISTVCRDKTDIKIYCCANTVSKFSWLLIYYGFEINKLVQGDIVTKEYPKDDDKKLTLRVSLEYCATNKEIGKKTGKYLSNPKMITSGDWDIKDITQIPEVNNEMVTDSLLFTVYNEDADVIIGCFLRQARWKTAEINDELKLYYYKDHYREFLVLKQIDYTSNYFHLTTEKTLNYHTYNDFKLMLADIKETTEIDFVREFYMGRIFADNIFTADYFRNCWTVYNRVTPGMLL